MPRQRVNHRREIYELPDDFSRRLMRFHEESGLLALPVSQSERLFLERPTSLAICSWLGPKDTLRFNTFCPSDAMGVDLRYSIFRRRVGESSIRGHEVSTNTRKNYISQWRRFGEWASDRGVTAGSARVQARNAPDGSGGDILRTQGRGVCRSLRGGGGEGHA